MANDKVKLGTTTDGKLFTAVDLMATSVVATNGETAESHMTNSKKHVPIPVAGDVNKVLTANADGTTKWNSVASTYTKTEVDSKDTSTLNSAKTYTDTKVAALVGTAPTTLDTLEEIATAISSNKTVVDAINASIGNKQDKLPATTKLLKGNNTVGGIVDAVAGTDYVVPTGNVATADKLKTARTIAISGGVTGTATNFDGSGNITIPVTAIDASKITSGTLNEARIPTLSAGKLGNSPKDICIVATEAEIATSNVRVGGIVLMKV